MLYKVRLQLSVSFSRSFSLSSSLDSCALFPNKLVLCESITLTSSVVPLSRRILFTEIEYRNH